MKAAELMSQFKVLWVEKNLVNWKESDDVALNYFVLTSLTLTLSEWLLGSLCWSKLIENIFTSRLIINIILFCKFSKHHFSRTGYYSALSLQMAMVHNHNMIFTMIVITIFREKLWKSSLMFFRIIKIDNFLKSQETR